MKKIDDIAQSLGIQNDCLIKYGDYIAKIARIGGCEHLPLKGKLILVTAVTPTPAGEGKTTTAIGLADAFRKIGHNATVALREPSLGPVFGMKGGATGGGKARVVPSDKINLHFTGDIHAVTTAHNLLSAMVDNRLHFDPACQLMDSRNVVWRRVLDMDDRVLRDVVVGIGGPLRGIARETGFDITAASEVMAIFCLATDLHDLRDRLGNIVIGYSSEGKPVFARDVKAEGAMAALLKDALQPNLVQTLEGTPAIIHGGPFANIAHGTNSIIATRTALSLSDYVITECGFGSDLGAEKFFNIVVRSGKIPMPSACVIVATIRALKYHGGLSLKNLSNPDINALETGFANLEKHIEIVKSFGAPVIVTINRFPDDQDQELARLKQLCTALSIPISVSEVFAHGGDGGVELAHQVVAHSGSGKPEQTQWTYPNDMPLLDKIRSVATKLYGAKDVAMEGKIRRKIKRLEVEGFGNLPICIAKTQYSLSDDPDLKGCPRDFTLIVTDASVSAGAGFVVIYCGDIMTMPGLPKFPAAESIDIDESGEIAGL
ncbi:formate--tetrahydrofolate ligase [bacterium]|nr:formate--tetrahydrofolate ligase [bacterium]